MAGFPLWDDIEIVPGVPLAVCLTCFCLVAEDAKLLHGRWHAHLVNPIELPESAEAWEASLVTEEE